MIEWLRALSPTFRYSAYAAGLLLVIFMAVGMGAAAAVVVGWQSGGSKLETTATTQASEDTAIDSSGDSTKSSEKAVEASFVHRATEENSRGDYTIISDPSINGDANAIVLVSPTSDPSNSGAGSYEHNIGVWYVSAPRRWAIFNQDRAPVPAGATFEVEVPQASARLVHEAGLLNTAENYTYVDNRLTNGEPDAVLSVTQNWNPGGGRGVYNNHPVDLIYDAKVEKWAVYNRDGESMPVGAAFNISVSAGADKPAR